MGSELVGREQEQELLRELINSKRPEFIAVYGRRRVGKTYLIKHFVDATSCVFMHVTGIQDGSMEEQLAEFAKKLGEAFYTGASIATSRSWLAAFDELQKAIERVPSDRKIVLFFDELPWMVTPRSRFLSALGYYWNRHWAFDKRIKLIVCGSATSWIIERIINNRGGLHNRVTRTIHLQPFTLHEVEQLLQKGGIRLARRQILELYIALGGVPLYWGYIRKGQSAQQCIDALCFEKGGPLVDEFERLFASLFDDPQPYTDLIRAIAKHRYGIGQAQLISEVGAPDGGNTTHRLKQLEEAGFITSCVPYGHKGKGIYYLVDDEYCLFYLHWIEPNKRLKGPHKGFWQTHAQLPTWKSWRGYAFEMVCFKHLAQIRSALKISPGAIAATWRFVPRSPKQQGAQVDLLFDRPDDSITICEIKCTDEPFAIDKVYAQALQTKMAAFHKHTRTKKQLFLALITNCGLKSTMYSEELVSGATELETLFAPLPN